MGDTLQPDVFESSTVTAAKKHRCCECLADIQKGEQYQSVRGLWDGLWSTHRTCTTCADFRERVEAKHYIGPDEGPAFGYLREWCHDADIEWEGGTP
uniref:Uncharacterized protein n=1 Tax=viral metagenome TaxID=1070528 RepID=A0A6M3IML8_9ZZZZ